MTFIFFIIFISLFYVVSFGHVLTKCYLDYGQKDVYELFFDGGAFKKNYFNFNLI